MNWGEKLPSVVCWGEAVKPRANENKPEDQHSVVGLILMLAQASKKPSLATLGSDVAFQDTEIPELQPLTLCQVSLGVCK